MTTPVKTAVLLAAGRGTRMKHLTEDVPKPMLPVAGRPLLEHIVVALRAAGVERFVAVVGYQAERIESHFGDGSALGVSIVYRRQTVQDGTARALLLARDAADGAPFVLGWGDILTDRANYPRLIGRFDEGDVALVLAVNRVEDPCKGAAVYADPDGRITKIVEKPPPGTSTTHWNNAGIAVASPEMFGYLERVGKSPRGEYEIPDAVSAMIATGEKLVAVPLEGPWLDVGTPDDLARAEAYLGK
ncbi:MAG: nucleotidyltransferase family protein [Candidatus Binatia bacterium]